MIALLVAIFWEWRHPDPVVEIRLLADRNFAIANFYYFLFGFALFGSTVLIPQMLQSLYGYTATDAGLALGPGALVIVALAPLIVRILPKLGVKPLIFVGYIIFGMAMWRYASFDLGTDYQHIALARALQGLGIAPLFVPVSQLAYSFLPKDKNNKASSLTNLFRNQGGSVGIAFVTTVLARRTQFHQSILAEYANPTHARYRQSFAAMCRYFAAHGFSPRRRAAREGTDSANRRAAGCVPGIPRLFLAAGLRLLDWSPAGFLHAKIHKSRARRCALTA